MAGLLLFLIANSFPFLAFKLEGLVQETLLTTGAWQLYQQGQWEIAILVLLTTVAFPLLELLGMLYLLLPLKFGRRPRYAAPVMRMLHGIEPWAMAEVFMLGILASVVKLAKMATIVPGVAAWAFAALILVMAGISATFDPREVWKSFGEDT
jgi:paraquat-inducible protein A